MKLTLVRHGETDWNTCKRVQGRTDTSLNERGVLQAKAAAEYLMDKGIDAVYCAPLTRARHTAQAIAACAGIENIQMLDGLTEINFGAWEGKTDRELMEEFPGHWGDWNWVLDARLCREIGAEGADEILARALSCIGRIKNENPPDVHIAIVSHTMPIKLLTAHYIGLPLSRIRHIRIDNCASSVLKLHEDGGATLLCWNDTSYLGGLL